MEVTTNEHAMHTAIIWVEVEIQENLPTGECSGNTFQKIERFPMMIRGVNRNDCVKKTNEFIAEMKDQCKKT
jgi:hypothetical protein